MKLVKEDKALIKNENRAMVVHDDKVLFRACKSDFAIFDSNRDWKKCINKNKMQFKFKNGKVEIVSYFQNIEGNILCISVDKYNSLPDEEKINWNKQKLRIFKDKTSTAVIEAYNNLCDIHLNGYYCMENKYEEAVKILVKAVESGMIKIDYFNEYAAGKNIEEVMRFILCYIFKPCEYEWNLLIKGMIGVEVHKDLKTYALNPTDRRERPKIIENQTIYLKGFLNKRWDESGKYIKQDLPEIKIYYYSITKREGLNVAESEEEFKLEIKFYKDFFKNNDLKITDITTQIEIQKRLYKDLEKEVKKFLKKLSKGTLDMFMNNLKLVYNRQTKIKVKIDKIVGQILSEEMTLSHIMNDVKNVKKV